MKETVKDKFVVETVGVPSIAELSTEDKKAFALALLPLRQTLLTATLTERGLNTITQA